MKTEKLFFLILFVFFTNGVFAQNFFFKSGFLSGNAKVKIESQESVSPENLEPVLGIYVGLGHDLPINDRFGLKTELMLTLKGYRYDTKISFFNFPSYYPYLSMPILGKIKLDAPVSFEIGLEPAYSLTEITMETQVKSNRFDLNFMGGCSFQVSRRFELSFRVSAGLVPFEETTSRNYTGTRKLFHRTTQIGVGYYFGRVKESKAD